MKSFSFEKYLNVSIVIICISLGIGVMTWTTGIQAAFMQAMGVSRWGAMTVEPLLVISSFLLGLNLAKWHRRITVIFLIVLFGISLLMMVSMYAKKSYLVIDQHRASQRLVSLGEDSEKEIRGALKGLSDRGTTASKNIVKVIDQLQIQQKEIESNLKGEVVELRAIIDAIVLIIRVDEKIAVMIFSLFVSLAAVASPSFLFFSASMTLRKIMNIDQPTMAKAVPLLSLSLNQKLIKLMQDHVTGDAEEIAKILGMNLIVVRTQLSRIKKKLRES